MFSINLHRVSDTLVTEWYEGDGASVHGGRETFPVYMTDQFWAASSARADTWGGGDTDWQSGRFSLYRTVQLFLCRQVFA